VIIAKIIPEIIPEFAHRMTNIWRPGSVLYGIQKMPGILAVFTEFQLPFVFLFGFWQFGYFIGHNVVQADTCCLETIMGFFFQLEAMLWKTFKPQFVP
jgi:hypothetical protein